jgi:uncharacterized protein (DUF1778 family)
MPMPGSSSAVSVRVSPSERDLLEAAARHARTNLSDFIRRTALEAAELDLMERRVVTIPAADWERFEAWARAPAQEVPELRRLAASKPAWG